MFIFFNNNAVSLLSVLKLASVDTVNYQAYGLEQ